jgi:hypothetical protein
LCASPHRSVSGCTAPPDPGVGVDPVCLRALLIRLKLLKFIELAYNLLDVVAIPIDPVE